ncbi:MAG: succinate CoA transferase [Prevotellaceae bacterium]|jgi:succinate CoA transferase|nr:succinate CoA transferase [Prevotellaceae bacterium]
MLKIISAHEAASYINDGDVLAFSGFTASGAPKVVTEALAERAKAEHEAGKPFKTGIFTGASTSEHLDGALALADAIDFRTPYQSNANMRACINSRRIHYFDMHLSHLAQELRYGFHKKINLAIIEAADVSENGEIVLTSGVGIIPTAALLAEKIIIELNRFTPKSVKGLHDIYVPLDPPYRREIPVYKPSDRCGNAVLKVDPNKIIGIVETNLPDGLSPYTPADAITETIGANVADFLATQLRENKIPSSFLPIQSGVGNIANAVLGSLGANKYIPPFEMYTEVIQDSVIGLVRTGNIKFASGCSLSLSDDMMTEVYSDLNSFRDKFVLRPQEISNNPEIVRRLGLITINTALEADIFGNINSTHVLGTKMMNGIGGSGDFARNAYISIFTCPSVAKGGKISAIVPMVSHLDHSEHSVKVIITEQGIADLRGKSPVQRAKTIIENCVHPDYKQLLWDYLKLGGTSHTPHTLNACFKMHSEFLNSGDMRQTDWAK